MYQDRKEYRKNFSGEGLLYVGGEILTISCYDVSLKGAMVEVSVGDLLASFADFEALLAEDKRAEIFVEALMLAGEVDLVWVKREHSRIMMGMEFRDVVHNAQKLWRRRRGYRKNQSYAVDLFIDKERIAAEAVNRSTEGMCLRLNAPNPVIKVGLPIKLAVNELGLTALGKIVWVEISEVTCRFGLQLVIIQ